MLNSSASDGLPAAVDGHRILVVEDEILIRLMVSDELRDAGYHVIEACNADEALEILAMPLHFDLIVSDVRMPGSVDGLGLLARVKEAQPTLPVILMSGHLPPEIARSGGANRFVPKPFIMDDVLEAVRAELEEPL